MRGLLFLPHHILVEWLLLLSVVYCSDVDHHRQGQRRIVVTLYQYNACDIGSQLFSSSSTCASVAKCYGRRLVLNVQNCSFIQHQHPSENLSAAVQWIEEQLQATSVRMVEEDPVIMSTSTPNLPAENKMLLRSNAIVTAQLAQSSNYSDELVNGMDSTPYYKGSSEAQWNLWMLNVFEAWANLSTRGENSTVVVLDSGMALSALPAFGGEGGERIMQGYDFISDEMLAKDGD